MSTIVIISTEEDCLFLVSKLLENDRTICTLTFEEGLEAIEKENPKLVIVDCEAFCKEGIENLYRIREKFNGYILVWALDFFIEEYRDRGDDKTIFASKISGDLPKETEKILKKRMVLA